MTGVQTCALPIFLTSIAYNKVMLALRTEVAIRIRRTTAIDVRMATSMIKVIRTVTTRR